VLRGFPSHLDLTVSDLAASVHFYGVVLPRLGYRRFDEFGGGAPCWCITDGEGGTFSIALVEARSGDRGRHDRYTPGFHHAAFHVDRREEVEDFHRFLLGIGAAVLDAPAEYDYTPGYYAVFFADPDGMKLEVVFEPRLRGRPGAPAA
jgi:catechol 2,3-dioxygenase-like lactoylglutathione lyase family enzyme